MKSETLTITLSVDKEDNEVFLKTIKNDLIKYIVDRAMELGVDIDEIRALKHGMTVTGSLYRGGSVLDNAIPVCYDQQYVGSGSGMYYSGDHIKGCMPGYITGGGPSDKVSVSCDGTNKDGSVTTAEMSTNSPDIIKMTKESAEIMHRSARSVLPKN